MALNRADAGRAGARRAPRRVGFFASWPPSRDAVRIEGAPLVHRSAACGGSLSRHNGWAAASDMSTPPISPLTQALGLLKVELARARDAQTGASAAVSTPGGALASGGARVGVAAALQSMPARLRALRESENGSLPRAKALRLFVEAVLLDELGGALQLDPAFGDLLERTCRAIEQDDGAATLLADALQELDALAA